VNKHQGVYHIGFHIAP